LFLIFIFLFLDILIKKQGKIFRIEFNRPNKYNAITWEMYEG